VLAGELHLQRAGGVDDLRDPAGATARVRVREGFALLRPVLARQHHFVLRDEAIGRLRIRGELHARLGTAAARIGERTQPGIPPDAHASLLGREDRLLADREHRQHRGAG
jgi:hypothetical protein